MGEQIVHCLRGGYLAPVGGRADVELEPERQAAQAGEVEEYGDLPVLAPRQGVAHEVQQLGGDFGRRVDLRWAQAVVAAHEVHIYGAEVLYALVEVLLCYLVRRGSGALQGDDGGGVVRLRLAEGDARRAEVGLREALRELDELRYLRRDLRGAEHAGHVVHAPAVDADGPAYAVVPARDAGLVVDYLGVGRGHEGYHAHRKELVYVDLVRYEAGYQGLAVIAVLHVVPAEPGHGIEPEP